MGVLGYKGGKPTRVQVWGKWYKYREEMRRTRSIDDPSLQCELVDDAQNVVFTVSTPHYPEDKDYYTVFEVGNSHRRCGDFHTGQKRASGAVTDFEL